MSEYMDLAPFVPVDGRTTEGNRILYPIAKELLRKHRKLADKICRFRVGDIVEIPYPTGTVYICIDEITINDWDLVNGRYVAKVWGTECNKYGISAPDKGTLDCTAILRDEHRILKNIAGWRKSGT